MDSASFMRLASSSSRNLNMTRARLRGVVADHFGRARQRYPRRDFAGGGVEDLGVPTTLTLFDLSADVVVELRRHKVFLFVQVVDYCQTGRPRRCQQRRDVRHGILPPGQEVTNSSARYPIRKSRPVRSA